MRPIRWNLLPVFFSYSTHYITHLSLMQDELYMVSMRQLEMDLMLISSLPVVSEERQLVEKGRSVTSS